MNDRSEKMTRIMHLMHVIRKKVMFCPEMHKNMDISPAQGYLLAFLAKNPNTKIKDIAATFQVSSSAATQMVQQLVDKGYVLRTKGTEDKRQVALQVSERAKKMLKKRKERAVQVFSEMFAPLSDKELDTYIKLTEKLHKQITYEK